MAGKGGPEVNPRSCIVTGEAGDAANMIRFVLAPDGTVTPDLRRRLPGRGVWVGARRDLVEKAVRQKRFSRGFRSQVAVPDSLAGDIEALLEKEVAAALSMARKAGQLVTGFAKCDAAIRSGKAALVLHASDGAADGKRKLAQAMHMARELGATPITVCEPLSGEQMDLALGGHNVIHAAAMRGGTARRLEESARRLTTFREVPPS